MIVMKFGGTSVEDAKAIDRAAEIVRGRLAQRPVVVVSAMSKVTDQLLAMGRAAGAGDRKTALKHSRALRDRHYNTEGLDLRDQGRREPPNDAGGDVQAGSGRLRGARPDHPCGQ